MGMFRFGNVIVEISGGQTQTRFRDGTIVYAFHKKQLGQGFTAKRLGYPTAAAMNRDHDLLHSMLAHWLGLPHSPTLWDVAHGKPGTELHTIEEDAVLAVQRFAQASGADLMTVAKRYRGDE